MTVYMAEAAFIKHFNKWSDEQRDFHLSFDISHLSLQPIRNLS